MSVTPDFIGQRYKDTNTGNIWIANSTTPGDWTLEVQDSQVRWTPTTVRLGDVANAVGVDSAFERGTGITSITILSSVKHGGFVCENVPNLISVSAPNLVDVSALPGWGDSPALSVFQNPVLATASFPLVVGQADLSIDVETNPSLTSLVLTSLQTVFSLYVKTNVSLASLSFPSFVTSSFGDINFSGNTNLASVSMPMYSPNNNDFVVAKNCAIDAASLNAVLAAFVANPAVVTGEIDFTGGTNAGPSGQGIADKATLIGRGVVVNTN